MSNLSTMNSTLATETMTTANGTGDINPAPLFRVSTLEHVALLTLWLLYCCTGRWALDQPLRIIGLIRECIKVPITNLWFKKRDLGLSLFVIHLLGRFSISTDRMGLCQGSAIVFWMTLDMAAMFYEPLKIANAVCEALMAVGVIIYLIILTKNLQERGRRRWLLKLGAILLWGMGWGIVTALYCSACVDQVIMIVWFMTYAACFPRPATVAKPGASPPIQLRSPWLASIARRRAGNQA
ncbi:uncharacterized protein V6R79_005004 [Siganus canaliculatus]